MSKKYEVPNFFEAAKVVRRETAVMVGVEAVKFFKEGFVKGGFTDTSFSPWKKSNSPLAGKRALYKSGKLMQSIRKQEGSDKRVVVNADSDYADIQNDGGVVVVTAKMKKYFWAMLLRFGKPKLKSNGKPDWSSIRKTPKTEFIKSMALKKVGTKIKIPKNQFIGNSQALNSRLETEYIKLIQREMRKAFRNIR